MDQNKLLKAFEKAKATHSSKEDVLERAEALIGKSAKRVSSTQKVESAYSLVATPNVSSPNADISKFITHYPMSVATMKKNKLIYTGMKNQAVLNAYRELRIKLKQKCEGSNASILVSSVAKNVESITTAMNLAISYSLDQKTSALVIDCNPYSDQLRSLITTDYDLGLTDYVDNSQIGIENIIYQSGIDRVSVIPSGSNHDRAVELFSSSEMNDLLYELKNRYSDRNIIVNTPPVLKTSEARVLTEYCDLTVLTVPFGKSSNADIEDAVNAIGANHIAGVIYQH